MLDLPDPNDLPDRPLPRPSPFERVASWLQWVGPARVAATSVAVVAVVVAGYWLVRPPAPTTESTLPYAAGAGSSTSPPSEPVAASSESAAPGVADDVVVHVAGAVGASGVYSLPGDARVIDAVQAAGGFAADAQPDAVNLAAPLTDGERVYIPREGETTPASVEDAGAASAPAGPIDINRATVDDLDELPGVGPATAAAIVAHREQHGPFGSVDDLADVRGIGPAKLEALRGLVTV